MCGNPIKEFISDHLYNELSAKGFLNERAIRDYYLKKRFIELRSAYSPREIFSLLQEEFPYICEDTIRKIIYTRNGIDSFMANFISVRHNRKSCRIDSEQSRA